MDARTNRPLFTAAQWKCGDGREDGLSYKWTTIHCLTVTVQWWTLLQMDHCSLLGSDNVGDGRSYKWSTIYCLTVTVRRWTLLQFHHFLLLHSESAKMVALTNEALFTASQWESGDRRSYKWNTIFAASQWQCEDGSTYKWNTIQYLRVRMWKMDSLTNGHLFTSLQWQCGDGRSYKWTTIFCFTVTVRRWTLLLLDHYSQPHRDSTNMDAPRNGPKFIASQWQCGDGRSYKWTTIHCLNVIVWTWTLLERNNYSLPQGDSGNMAALTNGPLFTASSS